MNSVRTADRVKEMRVTSSATGDGLQAEVMLAGTPYLIDDRRSGEITFAKILKRAGDIQANAERVGTRIRDQAGEVFESFGLILRSELVSESNRIESIDWSPDQVRQAVLANKDLLTLPAHAFVESVRGDDRTYEALGLYRAQLLADEWAIEGAIPRQIEIRQLHRLILGPVSHAGRYKVGHNSIAGAAHTPPAPADAAEGMRSLAQWWESGSGSPALDATVIHAWLAHLHPFDDGNGRLARLLANMALSQHAYPPLIIEAASDRGEYYDALAASDEGDILPLFDLFTRLMRRAVKRMGHPEYIENVIRDRMLTSPAQQQRLWQAQVEHLTDTLRHHLRQEGLDAQVQGYPSAAAFEDLANRNSDGNSWHLKVTKSNRPEWLLWFGFNSWDYCDMFDGPSGYPSVFLSRRTDDPAALHPYTPVPPSDDRSLWTELVVVPGRAQPARLRIGHEWKELSLHDAATRAAGLIAAST